MRFYCTHFDINYIAYARSLYDSLVVHGGEFKLVMFCMCDESYNYLQKANLENVVLVHFEKLEKFLPNLLAVKHTRSKVEYFYTCSPCTCYYVLKHYEEADIITYLDADLYFFNSPAPLFEELGDNSIGIIEHKFSFFSKRNLIYGRFNVGWINFRNDEVGIQCLTDWMEDCIDWCYHKLEDGKYGDQKYLDSWPNKYPNLKILNHKGANLGMWNVGNYKLTERQGCIYVDDEKLLFYHFASLNQVSEKVFKTNLSKVFVRTSGVLRTKIYLPYAINLHNNMLKKQRVFTKSDTHIKSNIWAFLKTKFSRKIRAYLFPDLISI